MHVQVRQLGPGDDAAVLEAGSLFDGSPEPEATRRFLAEPTHHLLIAYDGDGRGLGFVTGVETTHPDKGTEMFLYELGVDEASRRQGIGRRLVEELAVLARERGCFGMWVSVDTSNEAARATYASAGGKASAGVMVVEWEFTGMLGE